jgi:hypothetical protein
MCIKIQAMVYYFNNFSNSSTVSPAALIKCFNKPGFKLGIQGMPV